MQEYGLLPMLRHDVRMKVRWVRTRYEELLLDLYRLDLRMRGWTVLRISPDKYDRVSHEDSFPLHKNGKFQYRSVIRRISPEVVAWMNENSGNRSGYQTVGRRKMYFYFKSPDHAFAFKMRWL